MLSIIIVNYNVKYFLEQCLYAVQKAISSISAEVIVVDNNSTDNSVEYLQKIFPTVRFVANTKNLGFAKANNQGSEIARGEYILFLNPDTIIGEDCLVQSLQALEKNDAIGALGIRMQDGSGRFLPESKRGFPSPQVSFYRLSGLTHLFPHSKKIARYYMGHLPEHENNEVDVLTGAYMMVKKAVLDKTGGFDERFFMYGEDIDLSYRIKQAGYKNYYLAESSIIHFKGESTNKNIAYTKLFYKAMRKFVEKHYEKESWPYTKMVQMAIGIRSILAFVVHPFKRRSVAAPANGLLQTLMVGGSTETMKAIDALQHQSVKRSIIAVTTLKDITAAMQLQKTSEIIFCAGVIAYKDIIRCMEDLQHNVDYKFFAAGSNSIVGSMSKNNSGETVVLY